MDYKFNSFLIEDKNVFPKSLLDSLEQISFLSCKFSVNWQQKNIIDAISNSEMAIKHIDHVVNEILRHRDIKNKMTGWEESSFKSALDSIVGEVVDPASRDDKDFFEALEAGKGTLPGSNVKKLKLSVALNKLKHRDPKNVNFQITASNSHFLYIYATGGMGAKDTISKIDISIFCSACDSVIRSV